MKWQNSRQSSGVALIGVLLLLIVLGMLATALVMVHRQHWLLSRGQDQRIAAHQACLSAVEYAQNRLQAVPNWGTLPFGGSSVQLEISGKLRATEQGTTPADNVVLLELLRADGSARLQLVNNLDGTAQAAPPPWCSRNLQVPPQAAMLVVLGRCGGQQRRMEVLLRRRPPLDGAVYAGWDAAFVPNAGGADRVEFDGEDSTRNKLRARHEIFLPGVARFLSQGALTGQEDIRVGATVTVDPATGAVTAASGGTSLRGDPAQQGTLENDLNAHLHLGPVPQHRLDPSDLVTGLGTARSVPAGKYTFVGPGRVVLEPAGGGPPVTYQDAIYDGGATSGSQDQRAVALLNRKFMPQGQVEVGGNLELDTTGATAQAELAMGYLGDQGGIAQADGLSSMRVRGQLQVRGHLLGQGSIWTDGDLEVSGRSSVASGSSTALALFSEGNIRMRPTEVTGDITLAADFEALVASGLTPGLRNGLDDFLNYNDTNRDTLVGEDEYRELDPTTTGRVRDAIISASDYQGRVLPLVPNWPSATPAGHPIPPAALDFLNSCLNPPPGDSPFNCGMTMGRHTRLMAFLRSVDEGSPEPGWLDQVDFGDTGNPNHVYNARVKGVLKNQLFRVAQDARLEGQTPTQWLSNAGAFYRDKHRRDIDWRGLIYAKGGLWARGQERIDVVGALGAETGTLLFHDFKSSRVKFQREELNRAFHQTSLRLEGYSCYLD